jgi:glycerol-3-phosphate cytidylyltransferase-like family protein
MFRYSNYMAKVKGKGDLGAGLLVLGTAPVKYAPLLLTQISPQYDVYTYGEGRARVLAALESVDYVTVFDEDDPGRLIGELDPDIIVKGSDWKEDEIIGGDHVKNKGGKVVRIPLREGHSTTSLIKKIKAL